MDTIKIKSIKFTQLKGLQDIEIQFADAITAIMGVNGAGKSTVIHALACVFNSGGGYQFRDFFVPNTDSLWDGSSFSATYEINASSKTIEFKKEKQWLPQSDRRPSRDVYYIGIESCLPEIEKHKSAGQILYNSKELIDNTAKKILKYMSQIFNRQYDALFDNELSGTILDGPPDIKKMKEIQHLSGIRIKDGAKYSSISMGAGEQRIYKILQILLAAKPYSLLLIDEIDLLLHVSALKKLLEIVNEVARKRNMQVIFTTHSLDVLKLFDIPKIQYIYEDDGKLTVYDQITDDLVFNLTGISDSHPKYRIYVEDTLSKELVRRLIKNTYGDLSDFDIISFGAIENAFTLAASFVLDNLDHCNDLIVLDGDKYISYDEKKNQIKAKLSGTEENVEQKWETALAFITQFNLPNTVPSPEKYLYDLIRLNFPHNSSVYRESTHIKVIENSHDYINTILYRLGYKESDVVEEIFTHCKSDVSFINYLASIKERIGNLVKEPISIG